MTGVSYQRAPAIELADHVVSQAVDRRHALVRDLHAGAAHTEVTHRMVGNQVSTP